MQIRACLDSGERSQRLERELLLMHVLQKDRAWLYTHDDVLLEPGELDAYQALLNRRINGEPIAYLTGTRSFWDHEFQVNEHCLIPRADTELLVELASGLLPDDFKGHVIDLGTGSGILAISIALIRPDCHVVATDINAHTLQLAESNAQRLGATNVAFVESDWFAELAGQQFDMIISNPPYIRSTDPHLDQGDLRFEPRRALDGGDDGLDAYRRIIEGCKDHLTDSGHLLLEHGHDQREHLCDLLHAAGFDTLQIQDDLAGIPRAIVASRAPATAT